MFQSYDDLLLFFERPRHCRFRRESLLTTIHSSDLGQSAFIRIRTLPVYGEMPIVFFHLGADALL